LTCFKVMRCKDINQTVSSNQSLKTDRGLRSRFNLDEFHEDGDVGLFLPLDDTLLNRACATPLPAETADDQITTCRPSAQISSAVNITQQVVFEEDCETLRMDLPM
jgi:hypothetical protein